MDPLIVDAAEHRPRDRSAAPTAALAVLGPQATLERGYAIVRRGADGVDRPRSGRCAAGIEVVPPGRPWRAPGLRGSAMIRGSVSGLAEAIVFLGVVARHRRGRGAAWYAPRPASRPHDPTRRRGRWWPPRLIPRSTPSASTTRWPSSSGPSPSSRPVGSRSRSRSRCTSAACRAPGAVRAAPRRRGAARPATRRAGRRCPRDTRRHVPRTPPTSQAAGSMILHRAAGVSCRETSDLQGTGLDSIITSMAR